MLQTSGGLVPHFIPGSALAALLLIPHLDERAFAQPALDAVCAKCHPAQAARYAMSSMSRSLLPVGSTERIEDFGRGNSFTHELSHRSYRMAERNGRFYQQRTTSGAIGETPPFEREITHVIGSGRHARSYLSLAANGELTQLPVTWYTEERRWAMSPGYDLPRHQDFARVVDSGCLFCHAGYPEQPSEAMDAGVWGGSLPGPIGCARCHGPGGQHVRLAQSGAAPAALRKAIVNPIRLTAVLQMDVCLQCHLQSTSAPLPHAIRRYSRAAFSFRPGEPLSSFLVHFKPAAAPADDFEINSHGYRLLQSQCFRQSAGKLTCVTCHPIHTSPAASPSQPCLSCHKPHPDQARARCISCHMPKRRTADAIHVVMTDHLIRRTPIGGDPVAVLAERDYSAPLQPAPLFESSPLYLGAALVARHENLASGTAILRKALTPSSPAGAVFALAKAEAALGNGAAAASLYARALAARPDWPAAHIAYGDFLLAAGQPESAAREFRAALAGPAKPASAALGLARIEIQSGRLSAAIEPLQLAATSASARAEALSNLSNVLAALDKPEKAFRAAQDSLAFDPAFADAHNSLGRLLAAQGKLDRALAEFQLAARLDPALAEAHFNAGRILHATGHPGEAIPAYREALRLKPRLVEAHLSLGVALGESGDLQGGQKEFREALRLAPGHPEARRNLAEIERLLKAR